MFGRKRHAYKYEYHKCDRQSRTHVPVVACRKILFDYVSDELELASAEDVGDYE